MDEEERNLPAGTAQRSPPPGPPANARVSVAKTPRAPSDSFRRSEATLAGDIARAVARGQRVL
jgi:hypothetical protein